jgi:hypothetical protein
MTADDCDDAEADDVFQRNEKEFFESRERKNVIARL